MSHPRFVETLEALDDALARAAEKRPVSDDAFREALAGVMLRPRALIGNLPRDPAGEEFRCLQLRLYESLTQHAYDVGREETKFDRAHALRWPFPYVTRSAATVGSYLMAYGQIIREMNLPPGAHILEMGSGYGPLTFELASMGYRVTCVDMSEKLLEYVSARCAGLPGRVDVVRCDMNAFEIDGVYDAVVFFESFHHVLNHAELLRRLVGCLDDKGILVFAGEPIVPDDSEIVPYPWGLRMDGMSLWAIRRDGWLELGFRVDYFEKLLNKTGWSHRRVPSVSTPSGELWICARSEAKRTQSHADDEPVRSWFADDSALLTQCGERDIASRTIRSRNAAGYLCYGPYVSMGPGTYEVEWEGLYSSSAPSAVGEIACQRGQDILREVRLEPGDGAVARARFHLREPVADAEFRLRVGTNDVVSLAKISLRRLRTAGSSHP